MRDPDIIDAFTDPATGIELEAIKNHEGRIIWGAWHPGYMGKPGMSVGATSGEALSKLLCRRPELAPRAAA
jgi:hypothetical protein